MVTEKIRGKDNLTGICRMTLDWHHQQLYELPANTRQEMVRAVLKWKLVGKKSLVGGLKEMDEYSEKRS